jgi:hypothetical protein
VSTLKIPLEQIGYLQDDYQPAGYGSGELRRKSIKQPVAATYNGGGASREEEEEERVEPGFDDEYDDDDQGEEFKCE